MIKARKTAIILGGNIGETESFFDFAEAEFRRGGVTSIRRGRIFRTAPVDCVPGTPDFLNQALLGEWKGSGAELLKLCKRIETAAGRPEHHSSAESRVLDCDIILLGELEISSPELTIPHPRALNRRFVLEPLAELVPGWQIPGTGMSVAEALARLDDAGH